MLTNDELIFLNSLCSPFVPNNTASVISKSNYYIRKELDFNIDLLEHQKKCKELIDDDDNEYVLLGLWINKITPNTNKNDKFHFDETDLTIVTYINDTFDGGEFEYIENKNLFKIKPIRNVSLFMDNKLKHRVLKITKNERFSLISFYKKNQKKEKTII
jgi:hypothetical protein